MKTEKTQTRHYLTDKDRDAALKMIKCGLTADEAAELLHISNSSVNYLRQAYNACINEDWNTLQKLSTRLKPTVEWAMRVTGVDKKLAEELMSQNDKAEEPAEQVVEPPVVVAPITREDFMAMYATMQDVRNLLIEIRDVLK